MARSPAPGATTPAPNGDWTIQTADRVERVVTGIRDRTTVPLTTLARALVYGPGRPDRRRLRRPGEPQAPRHRGRAVVDQRPARRPAHAHHRGGELSGLRRRDHGPRADGHVPGPSGPLRRRVPDP